MPLHLPNLVLARPLRRLFAGSALVLALTGCAPYATQSPGLGYSPVNAVKDAADPHLMLAGHDVVAYFTEGRHRLGEPGLKSVFKGVTFRFATPAHKALFDQDPQRYLPQFGGYCANGIVYGIPWGGDADSWRVIAGKLYIFGGAGSRAAFELDIPGNIRLAERYWQDEVSNANALVQRTRRLVLRVPHYKSGEELAAMVSKARGG
jgi:hypothetical protein